MAFSSRLMPKKTSGFLLRLVFLLVCLVAWVTNSANGASPQTHDEKPIELSGFSISQSYEIEDGRQLAMSDSMLQQLVFRISKSSDQTLAKYTKYTDGVTWPQVFDSISDHRLRVFDRAGHVQSVEKFRFPGVSRDDPIRGCYVAKCVDDSGQRFQVITLSNPDRWKIGTPLNEPIRFKGFLYALVDGSQTTVVEAKEFPDQQTVEQQSAEQQAAESSIENLVPTFVAIRLGWFPDTVNDALGVNDSHVLLAKHGVDAGQFEFVRLQNSRPLGEKDSVSFFQFLSAVKAIGMKETGLAGIGFAKLMRAPKTSFGKAVTFRARVKKCSPVLSPEAKKKLGTDQYYQLIVFPDLDGQEIEVNESDGTKLVYNRFPVTVCSCRLPNGMKATDIENQQVLIKGFYFRFWKYQSDLTDQKGVSGQISPIIVTDLPLMVESDEATLNSILGLFLLALVLGLIFLILYFRSSGEKSERPFSKLPDQIDLSGVES